jgi:hypothetical protein
MQRVAETYRKLRNTFRFLLSNLNGFEPEKGCGCLGADAAPRPVHAGAHARAHGKDPALV